MAIETSLLRNQLLERRKRLVAAPSTSDIVRLLQQVDAALERMEEGKYGMCIVCQGEIEPERLLADPLATVCLEDLGERERRALEEDLGLAGRIQRSLLPPCAVFVSGWDACHHYEPAGPVSGDYCDLLELDGGLFFAAGDVSGKGVAASLLMSHLHATFHSLLSVGLGTEEIVGRANRVFCESTLPTHYATLACGVASAGGDIVLSNAGHCPPLLLQGRRAMPLEATGLPLGLFCDSRYTVSRAQLAPGDTLVLYSDGITEARNPAGEEYGAERLAAVLTQYAAWPADRLIAAALEDLGVFLHGASKTDDVTILAVQRSRP